jgi:addiction module RelB/DinJ family antitoxin
MISMATISTRVDDSIKEDFAKLCESMGLSMGTAVTLWIKQFLRTKKLEVTIDTEEEFNH